MSTTQTNKSEWIELSRDDEGNPGMPGTSYSVLEAIVEQKGERFRVRVLDRWGSNQGYLEEHGRNDRQYRANTLDELLRVSIAAEKERKEVDDDMLTAIRQAIYAAEDQA